jgi:putative ABC transport system permease protein
VVFTVALAIGANALVFSGVRALLIRPLPFPDAERIVWIHGGNRATGTSREQLSANEAQSLAEQTATYDAVGVIGDRAFLRVDGDRRERWNGIWVTPSVFDVLGVRPVLGRPITVDDARAGTRVMLVSHERWTRDLSADTSLIGRPIRFYDGHTFILAGVLPSGLEFPLGHMPKSGNGSGYSIGVQDFWILGQEGETLPGGMTIARLREGITMAAARAEAAVLAGRLLTAGVTTDVGRSLEVMSLRDQALGLVAPGLRLAQAFAILMLVLACANLANLVLLRAYAREQEFAVQAALGASSGAIVRGIIVETVVLMVGGGLMGLAIATLARHALQFLAAGAVPLVERIVLDWPVVLFTVLVTGIATLVVAAVPSVFVVRGKGHASLLIGGRTQTASRRHARLRSGLVMGQVALALVLSVGAGLIATSFRRLMSVDAGYDSRGVITADVEIFDHPDPRSFYQELHRRLRALPGVEAMGLIQSTPLTGKWTFTDAFVVVGRAEDPASAPAVSGAFVAFDFFGAMKIPVVRGRTFTADEFLADDAPSLMINESAARRFFPGTDPLGESVVISGKPRRIVGVVKDMRDVRLDTPPEPQWYQPLFGAGTQLIVRVGTDGSSAIPMVRRELLAVDPRFVVNGIAALDDIVASTVSERRMAMRLLAALAGIALLMAAIGLHGVVSFNVLRRRREFGVRSALGAQRAALMTMVLREGVRMALVGVAAGVVLVVWLAGALEQLLFEVSATDATTISATAVVLIVVAVVASLLPGWKAASVDPVEALRAE